VLYLIHRTRGFSVNVVVYYLKQAIENVLSLVYNCASMTLCLLRITGIFKRKWKSNLHFFEHGNCLDNLLSIWFAFRPLSLGKVNEFGIFEPIFEPDPDSGNGISTGNLSLSYIVHYGRHKNTQTNHERVSGWKLHLWVM